MRRILLVLMTLVSLNVFGQNDYFKVKEGSFKKIEGFVMIDKHYDMNDMPMAFIKISTENISAEQRRKFTFRGNRATMFEVEHNPNAIFLYVSAQAASFIEISHPDYGKCEFFLPYDLKDFGGYEMILQAQ